jgi:uncharacterized protein
MTYVPNGLDFGLLFAAAVLATIEVRMFSRLFKGSTEAATGRTRAYVFLMIYQWALVACIVALWTSQRRPWSALLLANPNAWGLWLGLALALTYVWIAILQRRAILRRPEALEKARASLAALEPLVPHTPAEHRLWPFGAVTAGCCEEILFRGFLFAFLASFVGVVTAVAVGAVLFGLFHAYYGPKGMLKTGVFGMLMALLALAAHSLLPVILIHAAIDYISGDVGYYVLSSATGESR